MVIGYMFSSLQSLCNIFWFEIHYCILHIVLQHLFLVQCLSSLHGDHFSDIDYMYICELVKKIILLLCYMYPPSITPEIKSSIICMDAWMEIFWEFH